MRPGHELVLIHKRVNKQTAMCLYKGVLMQHLVILCLDMEERTSSERSYNSVVFGDKIRKQEIVFLCQISLIFIVVIVSLVNLTAEIGNPLLWSTTLGSCLGSLLPNPKIKRETKIVSPDIRV